MGAGFTRVGDRVPCRAGPVTVKEQDGDLHTVIAATGRAFTTNSVGKQIIELCDGRNTSEQIVSAVLGRCAGTPATKVRKEVLRFLTAVTDLGVVTWVDAPCPGAGPGVPDDATRLTGAPVTAMSLDR
ncbi:MAG TPA: PqqD family protein [Pilimelia sp.]|nr:PqqD family protein [Pilimelia sp.]